MIKFHQHGTQVKVEIDPGINGSTMLLYWQADKEMLAYLLRDKLQTELGDKLRAIREEAYEKGWKDAKAKRAKSTWFARWWKN
jgi:hypothetical protein